MENRDWLNDYEALKKVSPVNPFQVPTDYFDSLAERIMSYKNLAELKQEGSTGGFAVPENYFTHLEDNIQSRINIEAALNNPESGFTIPDGYFDELSSNIQSRINIEETLNTQETGFAVPEGYFDELSSNIQSRIFVEEALNADNEAFAVPEGYFDELAGNIQSRIFIEESLAEQDEVFEVPEGYFDALHANITAKTIGAETVIVAKKQKPVKGIVRKLVFSTAFKYATAACFAVAIGGGILINLLSSPDSAHQKTFLHKQLSSISADDIKSYLQLDMDAGDTQQTVNSEDVKVDDKSLKDALKDDLDSVQ